MSSPLHSAWEEGRHTAPTGPVDRIARWYGLLMAQAMADGHGAASAPEVLDVAENMEVVFQHRLHGEASF